MKWSLEGFLGKRVMLTGYRGIEGSKEWLYSQSQRP